MFSAYSNVRLHEILYRSKNKPPKTSHDYLLNDFSLQNVTFWSMQSHDHQCTPFFLFSMTNFLFTHDALLPFSHKSQKMEEQVEDIQIEVDRGHNVFLGRQFVHHHACIKDDEEREKESTPSCDHSIHQDSGEENLLKQNLFI